MSEATTVDDVPADDVGEDVDFSEILQALFGQQQVEPDFELVTRGAALGEVVNDVLDRLGFHGEGGSPEGYDVHFSSEQVRWLLSAIGDFVVSQVIDNPHNAGTTLLDAAEVLVAAVG